jgi:hypothetical protein
MIENTYSIIYVCVHPVNVVILITLDLPPQIVKKCSNIKFRETLLHADGRIYERRGGQTDMTEVAVAFRKFSQEPKTVFS